MNLTEPQRRLLRSLAHARKPIVTIGRKGLSEEVLAELEVALSHHELVKIKIKIADRSERNAAITLLCAQTQAILIQKIGFVATLFRANPERPVIDLRAVASAS